MSEKRKPTKLANYLAVEKTVEELGVSENLVKEIALVQSNFVKKTIMSGNLEAVNIFGLGKIKPQFRKIRYINEIKGNVKN